MSFIRTSLKVTGLFEAIKIFKNMSIQDKTDKILEDIVKDTISLIMRYAAVDTGEMMESVHYIKNGKCDYTICVTAPQAIFNEYGTKYMPIGSAESPLSVISKSGKSAYRPFIRPAIWQMSSLYPEYFKMIKFKF